MFSVTNLKLRNGNYFSLTLFPYTSLAIRGANASGKTTMLKRIATLNLNKKASVSYDGIQEADFIQRNISFLSHELGLFQDLTAEEHLLFWAEIYNSGLMIPSAIHTMGIADHLEKPVKHLSAGNKKRLALAGILLQNRKVWILDEPFAHLDSSACEIVENMIDARKSSGGIVIFTTHDINNKSSVEFYL